VTSLAFLRCCTLLGDPGLRPTNEAAWAPAADVYETPAGVVVELEVPGADRATLRILVEGAALRVEGRKAPAVSPGDRAGVARVHRAERGSGAFARTLRLPGPVDGRRGRARLADGLLTILLPRLRASGDRP